MMVLEILIASVLIEALVEYAKEIREHTILIATILLGIAVSFIFDVALFNSVGANINHYADIVLSGIILSRGSNYASDFIQRISGK